MKNEKWLLLIVLACSLIFTACQKGDTGAKGDTGNANVQYSNWNSLNMNYSSSDSIYYQTITADSLTKAVLDSGIVLTYLKYPASTGQTVVLNASLYVQEVFSEKEITLYALDDLSGWQYRYVIVPGGLMVGRLAAGSTGAYTKEQLLAMSYEQVMKLLGKDL